MQTIENGKVVAISLTVVDNANGQVLETRSEELPVLYLHGHDNLVSSLEERLVGLSEGEEFEFTVEDGYGPAATSEPQEVPKREFPKAWHLEPGFSFLASGANGKQVRLWVHGVKGSRVTVSGEHPWCGRTVTFSGKVLGMRSATLEERNHGHAHGPGGHHH
ncbi:MAG: peptidylprolyl isomerase [Myxococcales bacterium]|nr:peptidylprolyl isomerase [Myxococcales bacterium]MCB9669913.1 peptidylprolyl isomerase [Alphaproteobacteria bacterium]MCB9693213.1 peptidylprolyl isomerase [Alphaproteobacteria bacterium]